MHILVKLTLGIFFFAPAGFAAQNLENLSPELLGQIDGGAQTVTIQALEYKVEAISKPDVLHQIVEKANQGVMQPCVYKCLDLPPQVINISYADKHTRFDYQNALLNDPITKLGFQVLNTQTGVSTMITLTCRDPHYAQYHQLTANELKIYKEKILKRNFF